MRRSVNLATVAAALLLSACNSELGNNADEGALAPPGGDLALMEVATLATEGSPRLVHLADLDGDGTPEILVGYEYYLGWDMAAGDLDGDGLTDLVAPGPEFTSNAVLSGNGDGTLSVSSDAGSGYGAEAITLGYFDEDAILDLASASEFAAYIHRGNGDGTFKDEVMAHRIDDLVRAMVSGDFNGDGSTDFLAVAAQHSFVMLMLGEGDGASFTKLDLSLNLGPLWSPVAADFNGDHLPDVALLAGDKVVVLLSAGSSLEPGPVLQLDGGRLSLAAADIDGDGRSDLVVGRRDAQELKVFYSVVE